MQILVSNPIQETFWFCIILFVLILASIRLRKNTEYGLSVEVTQELKGFAILVVIFAHIGYMASADSRFLFPLSVLGGVGVDLFLFLSGYGLTVSSFKKHVSTIQFYARRIIKLFIPMWIVLGMLLIFDFFILHRSYPLKEIVLSFLGFFPEADIARNINSPLWFITLILFFYIVYPFFFIKEHPVLSALLMFLAAYFVVDYGLESVWRVSHLYRVHLLAFPLGVAFAGLLYSAGRITEAVRYTYETWCKKLYIRRLIYVVVSLISLVIIAYFSIHSGVGKGMWKEQIISILIMSACLVLFWLKPFRIGLFGLVGVYSYEIYLIHWPMLYRYGFIYSFVPPFVTTIVYLVLFVGIGYLLSYVSAYASKKILKS